MLGDKLCSVGDLDNLGDVFLAEVEAAHLRDHNQGAVTIATYRTPSAAMAAYSHVPARVFYPSGKVRCDFFMRAFAPISSSVAGIWSAKPSLP
jgi:hypothetical protein